MKRIESQVVDSHTLAMQVLSWITCAKRPLTILELRHALAVEEGELKFDEENLPEIEDMVSVCAGLVTVDEESEIIRVVHYTTQEYFERTWTSWFPNVQRDIAITCVTYLLFDVFEAGFCRSNKEFETRLRLNPFYDYTARNWGHHVRTTSTDVVPLISTFLENQAKVSASSQAMMVSEKYRYGDYSQEVPRQLTGVHLAACFGLTEMTTKLLRSGYHSDCKDLYHRTPLSWAAENGHETAVRLLLERADVEADSKDRYGRTPLSWAAANGHEAVVKLLLERADAEANSKDTRFGWTPLLYAAANGHETVIRLLLERADVEADSKDRNGQTPLSWAAEKGHETVVQLLVERADVETNSKDGFGRTPLSWAAGNGHETVVRLLLERDDVEANSKDRKSQTPLSRAATNGHEAIVKLLLKRNDVETDSKNRND
jgi:ankyrin repeat protein